MLRIVIDELHFQSVLLRLSGSVVSNRLEISRWHYRGDLAVGSTIPEVAHDL
jgi:hypothetical protein